MAEYADSRPGSPHLEHVAIAPGRSAFTRLAPAVVAAALVVGVVALLVRDGAPGAAIAYAAGLAITGAVGLRHLSQGRARRVGIILLVAGGVWFVTGLGNMDEALPYSLGRLAAWLVEPLIAFLLLAFPLGYLRGRAERRVVGATTAVIALLFVPTALLGPFPDASPWAASCAQSCPGNAFELTDWAGVDPVRVLRLAISFVLFAAIAVLLVRRWQRSSSVARRELAPVAWIAGAKFGVYATFCIAQLIGGWSDGLVILGWAYVLTLPAVAVAFAVGGVRRKLFAADALEGLAMRVTPHVGAGDLRCALAESLEDPTLEVFYWAEGDDGHWVDQAGWPTSIDTESERRAVTIVYGREGARVAALVHDAELSRDPSLLLAASSFALTALENNRLARQLRTSVDDLHDSRARIVDAADAERRRVERDLHDGAQQRLVALRIQLALLAEQLSGSAADESLKLNELEREVDGTIDELRSFARGIYPPLLAERGLAEALRAAGRSAPLPTTVDVAGLHRYPLPVELTVYFGCVEALQNAAKHARGATGAWVTVTENGLLRFDVRDDGEGFLVDDVPRGSGLTNIGDRLAAVGGELMVRSTPGAGTTVTGTIPV